MVGRPIRKSRSGRKTHTESEIGRWTFLKVQNWSGDAPGCPEVVGVPSQRSGSGRGTLPKVRKGSGTLPKVWK